LKLWLDAHVSFRLAPWLEAEFGVQVEAVRDLGLRHAKDLPIFEAARQASVVMVTKDRDFVDLVERLGSPPQVLWLTLGNTTNRHLKEVFEARLSSALALLRRGEPVVELTEAP